MSNEFAHPNDAVVTASHTTPKEVDVERAMHAVRSEAGTVAQASVEVHGIPAQGHRA